MPAEPATAAAPSPLWRVERASPRLRFSRIGPADAANDHAGNRFDVPGAGVLYAATRRQGALAETLALFRPRAQADDAIRPLGLSPGRVVSGQVPAAWFAGRRMARLTVDGALPFLDVESPRTHTALTELAPGMLAGLGLGNLDVAAVRGPSRLVTRATAEWAYSRLDDRGRPLYAGIRYVSRLGDYECWAIFDGTPASRRGTTPLSPDDEDVRTVMELFGMTPQ